MEDGTKQVVVLGPESPALLNRLEELLWHRPVALHACCELRGVRPALAEWCARNEVTLTLHRGPGRGDDRVDKRVVDRLRPSLIVLVGEPNPDSIPVLRRAALYAVPVWHPNKVMPAPKVWPRKPSERIF